MLEITTKKMKRLNIKAHLSQGNVEKLPFPDNTFDTVINTMAFTGYPNGEKAVSELKRVLKNRGSLLLVDFEYPNNRNIFGYLIVRLWENFGDIIKDISSLLRQHDFDFEDISVGGSEKAMMGLLFNKKKYGKLFRTTDYDYTISGIETTAYTHRCSQLRK